MKYVGKTTTSIRVRLNGHRGNIRHGTEAFVMLNHFAGTDGHGICNMAIKPIELCTDKNTGKVLDSRIKYSVSLWAKHGHIFCWY